MAPLARAPVAMAANRLAGMNTRVYVFLLKSKYATSWSGVANVIGEMHRLSLRRIAICADAGSNARQVEGC